MNDLRKSKQIMAVLLACMMVIGLFPMAALAAETTAFEVQNEAEFIDAVTQANRAESGEFIIRLTKDITFSGDKNIAFTKNAVTLLGEGHTLTVNYGFILYEDATLNLGSADYGNTLNLTTKNQGIFSVQDESVLNIYDGVTIGHANTPGQPGAIGAKGSSIINMYGGTIEDCHSMAASGGVLLTDAAHFNLYDGTIKDCSGPFGGAVGIINTNPIVGWNPEWQRLSFYMYGGTIMNCEDNLAGGGAVCLYSLVESVFVMEGGVITGCTSVNGQGLGGAILTSSTHPESRVELKGGQIYGNSGNVGGGIFCETTVTIADHVSLYNNSATVAGDDIFNNGARVTIGEADTSCQLVCGHPVDGWYYDDEDARWSFGGCPAGAIENHHVMFTQTGEPITTSFALKAAHGEPSYKVRFDLNYEAAEGTPETQKVVNNGKASIPEEPQRSGWLFSGWYLGEVLYDFDTPVTVDIELTAHWKEDKNNNGVPDDGESKFTVTYTDGVDGEDIFADQITTGLLSGTDTPAFNGLPTRDGYTFTGWSPAVCDKVTADSIYKAQWKKETSPAPPQEPTDPPAEASVPADKNPPIGTYNPQTGDNSNLEMWIALMVEAGAGLTGTVICGGTRKQMGK